MCLAIEELISKDNTEKASEYKQNYYFSGLEAILKFLFIEKNMRKTFFANKCNLKFIKKIRKVENFVEFDFQILDYETV